MVIDEGTLDKPIFPKARAQKLIQNYYVAPF
jgi:hypothetical protein